MRITSTNTNPVPRNQNNQNSEPSSDTQNITQRIVDATVDKTLAGTDRVAGGISGTFTGAAAYLSKMPRLAGKSIKSVANLYGAEKIGPNIKVIATLASPAIAGLAVAGAGLGLVVAAGAGLVSGFSTHDARSHATSLWVKRSTKYGPTLVSRSPNSVKIWLRAAKRSKISR